MGLDMYLEAEKYVSGWEHGIAKNKKEFSDVFAAVGLLASDISSRSPGGYLTVNVLYWRKANAIHGWFVDNLQNGSDDCQRSYVPRELLKILADKCAKILSERDDKENGQTSDSADYIADDSTDDRALEPRSGFFFGSTEKDERYYENLKYTRDGIYKLLENPRLADFRFYYLASW
jgi:hypothetical protein